VESIVFDDSGDGGKMGGEAWPPAGAKYCIGVSALHLLPSCGGGHVKVVNIQLRWAGKSNYLKGDGRKIPFPVEINCGNAGALRVELVPSTLQ